jgi:hypothetical protein
MKGEDCLEQTIREENTPASLPVITLLNQVIEALLDDGVAPKRIFRYSYCPLRGY